MPQSEDNNYKDSAAVTAGLPVTPDKSFRRERRLTTPAQFKQVFQKNSRSADRYWTVLFRPNEIGHARLGMAVAKKRAKRAVDRNRLKRTVRESFRCQEGMAGVDIVVLPRESCVGAGNQELRNSLDKHWSRIAEICAKHYAR